MAQWLYNSEGTSIAFVNGKHVFSQQGKFIGNLDDDEVWHGEYQGEIVENDRLLYKFNHSQNIRSTPVTPITPLTALTPISKIRRSLPHGYRDIQLD
jgi:hypothetical protein